MKTPLQIALDALTVAGQLEPGEKVLVLDDDDTPLFIVERRGNDPVVRPLAEGGAA